MLALAGSALSGGYWWLVATLGFGLLGGDYAPGAAPPSPAGQAAGTAALLAAAVGLHALLARLWRRLEDRPRR